MRGFACGLRAVRGERGFTQDELARRSGISRQALNAIELGRAVPSTAIALDLARVLGCSVEDLFWIDDRPGSILADLAGPDPLVQPRKNRLALAEIAGRWVAHALPAGDLASLHIAADALCGA